MDDRREALKETLDLLEEQGWATPSSEAVDEIGILSLSATSWDKRSILHRFAVTLMPAAVSLLVAAIVCVVVGIHLANPNMLILSWIGGIILGVFLSVVLLRAKWLWDDKDDWSLANRVRMICRTEKLRSALIKQIEESRILRSTLIEQLTKAEALRTMRLKHGDQIEKIEQLRTTIAELIEPAEVVHTELIKALKEVDALQAELLVSADQVERLTAKLHDLTEQATRTTAIELAKLIKLSG